LAGWIFLVNVEGVLNLTAAGNVGHSKETCESRCEVSKKK
jgi:hypothetical protein